MSRKEWLAVIVVLGLGIVWQIPRHDDAIATDQRDHVRAPAPADAAGPYRRIALEVTGMT